MCMRFWQILALTVLLCGCRPPEMESLLSDLKAEEITKLSYEVGGFQVFECDPSKGKEILQSWSKTLKTAPVAVSWPRPDAYLVISFMNQHNYRIQTFTGVPKIGYSVVYADGIYTGERLMLEDVCPKLKAHNKLFEGTR